MVKTIVYLFREIITQINKTLIIVELKDLIVRFLFLKF